MCLGWLGLLLCWSPHLVVRLLRLASPRLASPRLASPRLASPCLASPRLALPRLASPCLALPCLALPCLALPCLALPCLALPCSAWFGLIALEALVAGFVTQVAGFVKPQSSHNSGSKRYSRTSIFGRWQLTRNGGHTFGPPRSPRCVVCEGCAHP